MREYIATFHTHLSALMTSRNLTGLGLQARMMPVPRKLSSSCGTCVRYHAEEALLEAIYEVVGKDEYVQLMDNE